MKQLITIGMSLSIYMILLFTAGIKVNAQGTAEGDFNNDGYADLAIGVPFADIFTSSAVLVTNAGEVHVIYGSANGLKAGTEAVVYNQNFDRESIERVGTAKTNDQFGKALAAGDFNGDGFSDLAIGIPRKDIKVGSLFKVDMGSVQVIYGSSSGLLYAGGSSFTGSSDGHHEGALFGSSLASGDFNEDGVTDIAVGATGWKHNAADNTGHVHVRFGRRGLLLNSNSPKTEISQTPRDIFGNRFDYPDSSTSTGFGSDIYVSDTAEDEDQFGEVLTAGDFDNDGDSDLVIGVPHEDLGSTTNCGMVTIIKGSPAGLTSNGMLSFDQDYPSFEGAREASDLFGDSLAAGDFNGDGKDDLAIGVPRENKGTISNTGAVNVVYGGNVGLSPFNYPNDQIIDQDSFSSNFQYPHAENLFGWSVAAGDFNGDGKDDLAVGVPGEDNGLQEIGAVIIYKGASTGLSGMLSVLLPHWGGNNYGSSDGDQFGYSLSVQDFGKGSRDDLVIGVPFYGTNNKGAVYVSYEASKGPYTELQFWDESMLSSISMPSDSFGTAVY